MRILPLIVLVACVACEAAARAQDDGEARPAPSRGLLKRGLLAKGKQTTTTTTPAPQEEAEYEDEAEYADGEAQEASTEAPPSSTEGKKLVSGGVRPFRSNTDLLEALKRRRAQAAEAKHGHSSAPAAPAQDSPVEAAAPAATPAKSSYSKKRYNNAPKESQNEEAPAPAKPSRGRFGRPASRSVQEEPEEQNESAPAPARSARTFARRGGN
ncbi:skin secretory protein xP2 isoform X1 [Pectinophora gossypiella]|uniref:skin secretory protein xP2 isoform X1 n=1 Tax=Pectinophora gossypiella TaxID=13191 RepID=UPI00214E7673|nr:skin secretory protein xP2 isoform X1 [Pectinophora gossypiella]